MNSYFVAALILLLVAVAAYIADERGTIGSAVLERLVKIFKILGPIATIVFVVLGSFTASRPTFNLQVHVVAASTRQSISGASVRLEVPEQAPKDALTDSTGYARLSISASLAGKPGTLIVEADGFETNIKNIDLGRDELPTTIRLRRAELLATPSAYSTLEQPDEGELTRQPNESEPPTIEPGAITPSTEDPTLRALEDVVMRAGPSTSCNEIGLLYKNDNALVLERTIGPVWWHIEGEVIGWVSQYDSDLNPLVLVTNADDVPSISNSEVTCPP